MKYYFAPLEGLTDHTYRTLHHQFFPGPDRYYTPFFSPTVHRKLTPREARELPPANTLPYTLIPQLLTKVPEDFLWMTQQCQQLGYSEVNLNLGCPSGTVTAKGKGAGMLLDPDALDRFLDEIFARSPLPVSIKTRIGFSAPGEFEKLLEIYNRYPVAELIVHPRVRKDFYSGRPHMAAFRLAAETANAPLCYNGDILSPEDADRIGRRFPGVKAVMVGRGLIGDPGMFTPGGTTPAQLEAFLDALTDAYIATFGSARNTMFRMKEHWQQILPNFPGSEKLGKALRKTTDIHEFRAITRELFQIYPFIPKKSVQ